MRYLLPAPPRRSSGRTRLHRAAASTSGSTTKIRRWPPRRCRRSSPPPTRCRSSSSARCTGRAGRSSSAPVTRVPPSRRRRCSGSSAEGATGPYFDLFFLIANPERQRRDRRGRATCCTDGTRDHEDYTVAPNSRFNIWVDFEARRAGQHARGRRRSASPTACRSSSSARCGGRERRPGRKATTARGHRDRREVGPGRRRGRRAGRDRDLHPHRQHVGIAVASYA